MARVADITDIIGTIPAPSELQPFIERGDQGAGGISTFLTSLIFLIYSIAGIVFIFMILWSAWEFITSGGDKEKVENARRRMTFAIIGIILFAVAFALIEVIGEFTGFSFFKEQGTPGQGPI